MQSLGTHTIRPIAAALDAIKSRVKDPGTHLCFGMTCVFCRDERTSIALL